MAIRQQAQIKKLLDISDKETFTRATAVKPRLNMEEEVVRAENLKNTAFEQDIRLKKITLIILFIFLGLETISVFLFAFLQGVTFQHFHLDEWSFKLLVSATLLQITYMVKIAVQHLFPNKKI